MKVVRLLAAASLAAAVLLPAAASADGRCKPFWYTENTPAGPVPMVTIVC